MVELMFNGKRKYSYNAELICCVLLNQFDFFKCEVCQEGPLIWEKMDIRGIINGLVNEEFGIQVKTRQTKRKPDKIIFKKVLTNEDIKYIENRGKPYILACFDSSLSLINGSNQGYYISFNKLINQLSEKKKNWRNLSKNTQINIEFDKKFEYSNKNMIELKEWIHSFYNESDFISEEKEIIVEDKILKPYISPNQFQYLQSIQGHQLIKDAYKQIKEDYSRKTIIEIISHNEMFNSERHSDIEFLMFPSHIKLPKKEFEGNYTYCFFDFFGFSMRKGELNNLYNQIELNSKINKINKLDIGNLVKLLSKIPFKFNTLLLPHQLYVEFLDHYSKNIFYENDHHIWNLENNKIDVYFVYNENSEGTILGMKDKCILRVIKESSQTENIKNIDYYIQISPEDEILDYKIYIEKDEIGLIIRSVNGIKILNPNNIYVISYENYESNI